MRNYIPYLLTIAIAAGVYFLVANEEFNIYNGFGVAIVLFTIMALITVAIFKTEF